VTRVYSNLKVFGYPDRLAAIAAGEVPAPVHVRIKPINHCNHGCWYCAYRADQLQLGEGMDLRDRLPEAKLFEIADDLVAMDVKAVTFSGGGEPLLYRALPEVVERLGRGGVRVAALTNGANLKGRMADAFAAHGTWVRVSIDAWDDASYAKSRGVKEGEFSRVIENLRAFIARGSNCVLGASFIVGRDNIDHLEEACALLKNIGVHHVKLSAAIISNDVAENNAYHRAFAECAAEQVARTCALADARFTVANHYHEMDGRFTKPYASCPFARMLTVIGADGVVYFCQDKAYTETGALGSIKDRRFRDFWFSAENKARLEALDPSRDCNHHCVAHAKNLALTEYFATDPAHGAFV
jgi:MoaA/NifB/PqqE/SkfB family radical SAM enzyme